MWNLKNKVLTLWKDYLVSFLKDPLFLSKWVSPYYPQESNKISVRVSNRGYSWPSYGYSGTPFMFIQDMHQGIMPFSHIRGDGSRFTARLEPDVDEMSNLVVDALDRRGHSRSVADALCDFIRDASQSLFTYGRVCYEIICEQDDDGNITRFKFIGIHPLSMRKIFGGYFQLIPWWVAKHSDVKVGIRRIPAKKIVNIEFPQSLGGRKSLIRILKRLSVLGQEVVPAFHMKSMQNNENIGFDLEKYVKEKYLEKAQLTKAFGWKQRKIPDKEILEYYSMYKNLRFSLSQAVVREHILDVINEALNGKLLNLGTKIVMEGIPSAQQIESEFLTLQNEDVEFMDLFERTTIK